MRIFKIMRVTKEAIGSIVEGRITGITKYGAFVSLDNQTSGMVHISEISFGFVKDINEHLKLNQIVKAVVIAITDDGKFALSIKQIPSNNLNNNLNESKESKENENVNVNVNELSNDSGDSEEKKEDKRKKPYGNKENRNVKTGKKDKTDKTDKIWEIPENPEEFFTFDKYDRRQKNNAGDFEDMLNKFKHDSDEKILDLKKSLNPKKSKKRLNTNQNGTK